MTTTEALLFDETGDPRDVLSVREIELGAPGPGQLTVTMEASPVDPTDLAFIRGRYAPPTLPGSSAGQSGLGRVVAVGVSVEGVEVGDRVVVIPNGRHQVWRRQLIADRADVVVVDGDTDPLQLAA